MEARTGCGIILIIAAVILFVIAGVHISKINEEIGMEIGDCYDKNGNKIIGLHCEKEIYNLGMGPPLIILGLIFILVSGMCLGDRFR